ncbi:pyridoxamine 5'-phosphate oxidase family protein [Altererythrobacter sp. Root672]|uniref:pyridoxamine 5'-phosphate oxidase family protein n=1 Tax=Altererythrobacter sp. Root672 TaxID=1736584 RepID=UPI000700D43F|nr:pyridoxamine 5'-phosphate oxidase family protein [Altererythrobacter sp. Root672]KRA83238.1 general stress protein [Altererythrobacter sp. Root672]
MDKATTLKHKFWTTLADSPFVFLQVGDDPQTAVPMMAQLDSEAHSTIWFFTSRRGPFAQGGKATATFTGKGHDLFARFSGTLIEETDAARFDLEWSPAVQAWFPGGKDDPNLLMLRMEIEDAEIWNLDYGLINTAKMMLGYDIRETAAGQHVQTKL